MTKANRDNPRRASALVAAAMGVMISVNVPAAHAQDVAPEVETTIKLLQTRIDRHGAFNTAAFERLADALERADLSTPEGRELLENSQDFAAGKIKPSVFMGYLETELGGTQPEEIGHVNERSPEDMALDGRIDSVVADLHAKYDGRSVKEMPEEEFLRLEEGIDARDYNSMQLAVQWLVASVTEWGPEQLAQARQMAREVRQDAELTDAEADAIMAQLLFDSPFDPKDFLPWATQVQDVPGVAEILARGYADGSLGFDLDRSHALFAKAESNGDNPTVRVGYAVLNDLANHIDGPRDANLSPEERLRRLRAAERFVITHETRDRNMEHPDTLALLAQFAFVLDDKPRAARLMRQAGNEAYATKIENGEDPWEPQCFITTAVVRAHAAADDCHLLTTLRRFRDQFMAVRPHLQACVEEYYRIAPAIVTAISQRLDAPRIWQRLASVYLQPAVCAIEQQHPWQAVHIYKSMVRDLQRELA